MFYKLHSWIAGNVRGVQYPKQEYIPRNPQAEYGLHWKNKMAWHDRLFLALFSTFGIVLLVPLLIVITFLAWAFFSSY
jgi:hypothetical protein